MKTEQRKLGADERREKICEVLEERGRVSVAELAEMFGVTMQTIRRDLKDLNLRNRLAKSHGKALKVESLFEPMFHARLERNIDQKRLIGEAACTLAADNDTIACDPTTTVYVFLRSLENRRNLSVFINSFVAARELQDKFLAGTLTGQVFFLGGRMDFGDFITHGPFLDSGLDRLYFDKVFIGAGGVDLVHGLSAFSDKVGHLAGRMLDRANEVILLADSTKIGKRTLYTFGELRKVSTIITTVPPPSEEWEAYLESHGIDWIQPG